MTFKEYLLEYDSPDTVKYHKDIYFPPQWGQDTLGFLGKLPPIKQGHHSSVERSYKHNYQITNKDLNPKDVFEMAYVRGQVEKIGFRVTHLDPINDIIYIINRYGKIVTTWVNRKTDTHRTLDANKYSRAETA